MFESITAQIILFLISGGLIWFFSNRLAGIVEFISEEFKLGSAFGGTIMLATITNLAEIAIIAKGAIGGDTSLAVGNILGGIAIQTLLLSFFDFYGRNEKTPLSTIISGHGSILQGLFLVFILALVVLGSQFAPMFVAYRISPIETTILSIWILSLLVVKRCEAAGLIPIPEKTSVHTRKYSRKGALLYLVIISLVILIFGYLLAGTSENISKYYNITGVVFGATVLSLITALPEISSGIVFVKTKNYLPISGDIFGGNSFLPVLFLLASLLSSHSILPEARKSDLYLTSLGSILTAIFLIGMIIKIPRKFYGMGLDSWVAVAFYTLGIIGLVLVN